MFTEKRSAACPTPKPAGFSSKRWRSPGVPRHFRIAELETPLSPIVPITFVKGDLTFEYFSMVTTLGTPQDVTLQELRIECFFPMDEATSVNARRLAG